MFFVLTYDVDFTNSAGQRRLAKVAKICEGYGVRVQNSVFEMNLDSAQIVCLKDRLMSVINQEYDSIRIYKLGRQYKNCIEIWGKEESIEIGTGSALIL